MMSEKILRMSAILCLLMVGSGQCVVAEESIPDLSAYILTPSSKPEPRINGAKVFGVRPGHPILYTIAATGNRPMKFSVKDLPEGAKLDAENGRISGSIAKRGTYRMMLKAENSRGSAERELRIVVGDEI